MRRGSRNSNYGFFGPDIRCFDRFTFSKKITICSTFMLIERRKVSRRSQRTSVLVFPFSRRRAIVIVNLEIQRSAYDLVNHGDSGPRGPCLSTILYCNWLWQLLRAERNSPQRYFYDVITPPPRQGHVLTKIQSLQFDLLNRRIRKRAKCWNSQLQAR